jgi:hypothetical protein
LKQLQDGIQCLQQEFVGMQFVQFQPRGSSTRDMTMKIRDPATDASQIHRNKGMDTAAIPIEDQCDHWK